MTSQEARIQLYISLPPVSITGTASASAARVDIPTNPIPNSSSSQYPYQDFSTVQDADVPASPKPSLRAERRRKRPKELSFPTKLHDLLTKCDQEGLTDIVAWQDHGRSFSIRDPEKFASRVMPLYFRQTKFHSFQRQLNLYGFKTLKSGIDRGAYYHERFLREKRVLARTMKRSKGKITTAKQKQMQRQASSSSTMTLYAPPADQPDLSSFPPLPQICGGKVEVNRTRLGGTSVFTVSSCGKITPSPAVSVTTATFLPPVQQPQDAAAVSSTCGSSTPTIVANGGGNSGTSSVTSSDNGGGYDDDDDMDDDDEEDLPTIPFSRIMQALAASSGTSSLSTHQQHTTPSTVMPCPSVTPLILSKPSSRDHNRVSGTDLCSSGGRPMALATTAENVDIAAQLMFNEVRDQQHHQLIDVSASFLKQKSQLLSSPNNMCSRFSATTSTTTSSMGFSGIRNEADLIVGALNAAAPYYRFDDAATAAAKRLAS